MIRILLLATAAVAAFAADRTYQTGSLTPYNMPPIFDHGYLIVAHDDFDIYSPDGRLAYNVPNPTGGGHYHNAAIDTDGSAALALRGQHLSGGSVLLLRPGGEPARDIPLGRFIPNYVAFAPDHTIWVAGLSDFSERVVQIRHLSRDGEEIGVHPVGRIELPNGDGVHQLAALRVSANRIGYLFRAGGVDVKDRRWVELSTDCKELGRWALPDEAHYAPVFLDGRAYITSSRGVLVLDRATGQWMPTTIGRGLVIGADGGSLVIADADSTTIRWVAP